MLFLGLKNVVNIWSIAMYVKITDVHFSEVYQMQVFICFLTAIVLLVVSGCANSKIQIHNDNQLIISDAN